MMFILDQCSQLAVPFNGDQTVSSDGLTTVATFRCNVNHTLMGRSTSSCLQNGSWSTPEPHLWYNIHPIKTQLWYTLRSIT
ncbi:hypothetical protein DPMN_114351 [Dreissena polymorpha]|uniref:Sushi domain-containing protein n=1 Tax=Dreissena polymorpha TaxID=45954 RepID=A0A9D4KJA0_DREPO|nr:hypothetical protein DPMN_114351 [Dreissena polymorpha]